jgi:hypothetical protein
MRQECLDAGVLIPQFHIVDDVKFALADGPALPANPFLEVAGLRGFGGIFVSGGHPASSLLQLFQLLRQLWQE